jgi:hypothetical protein
MKSINYDEIADTYDKRYTRAYGPEGIASKLLNLTQEVGAERILEVVGLKYCKRRRKYTAWICLSACCRKLSNVKAHFF